MEGTPHGDRTGALRLRFALCAARNCMYQAGTSPSRQRDRRLNHRSSGLHSLGEAAPACYAQKLLNYCTISRYCALIRVRIHGFCGSAGPIPWAMPPSRWLSLACAARLKSGSEVGSDDPPGPFPPRIVIVASRNHGALNMSGPLTGLIPASHTPLGPDGTLDLGVVEQQAELILESGIRSVFVGGTTGEFASLSLEERMALAERWCSRRGALCGLQSMSATTVCPRPLPLPLTPASPGRRPSPSWHRAISSPPRSRT